MATRFLIVHEFACEPAVFWSIFWDERFNTEQYEKMQCGRKVITLRDEEKLRTREQEITPQRSLPGLIRKVLGDGAFSYIEHAEFEKPAGPLRLRVSVPRLGERFALEGAYRVETLGPGRCRRTFEGECKVKIPLLGGQVEGLVVTQMKESYETSAAAEREWIASGKTSA